MKMKKSLNDSNEFVQVPGCDFEISKFQVTQFLWQRVMGNNPSYFKGITLPAETVSYDDIQEFLIKLNNMQKDYIYRLPTEEEWLKCFGKDLNADEEVLKQSWCYTNADSKTHPVGTKDSNEFGIYDMRGNVWEWTSTQYSSGRVIRGGSWNNNPARLRSALRNCDGPAWRSNVVGFRLVRTLRSSLLPSYPEHRASDSREEAKKIVDNIKKELVELEKLLLYPPKVK